MSVIARYQKFLHNHSFRQRVKKRKQVDLGFLKACYLKKELFFSLLSFRKSCNSHSKISEYSTCRNRWIFTCQSHHATRKIVLRTGLLCICKLLSKTAYTDLRLDYFKTVHVRFSGIYNSKAYDFLQAEPERKGDCKWGGNIIALLTLQLHGCKGVDGGKEALPIQYSPTLTEMTRV